MIQSALITLLQTISSKVYANVAPQKAALPVITVDLESSLRRRHYGTSNIQTGLIDTDFEINVWAPSPEASYPLAQQVISLLENFSGPLLGGDSPQTEYRVAGVEITSEQGGFDGQTEIFQYSIFITITHTTG